MTGDRVPLTAFADPNLPESKELTMTSRANVLHLWRGLAILAIPLPVLAAALPNEEAAETCFNDCPLPDVWLAARETHDSSSLAGRDRFGRLERRSDERRFISLQLDIDDFSQGTVIA